ncbi:helix-turn-helix domain-containing protein [Nocardia veterana]|uniref:Helix-turn-helix transcriptional regulator n=1 Tax=Nocardia veterana TaxID=132249 RepID=A0A7X6RJF5_9NOCA|nr:helix-turn-helix transcriptional regulator [Nocardia veterana]NKY87623.1 helix-turn-helix transcriptional regulator [Nocardia veterana]
MKASAAEVANPRMLVLARESRSLTQGQLAELMQKLADSAGRVSQGYVSRAEAGRLGVTGDRLELYAHALGYPVSLLCLTAQEVGAGAGLVHHRKKQAAAAGDLKRIHAMLNLTRIQLKGLTAGVPGRHRSGIPRIEVDNVTTPADAARAVRKALGVQNIPKVMRHTSPSSQSGRSATKLTLPQGNPPLPGGRPWTPISPIARP